MASATWPASLPQNHRMAGYTEQRTDERVRTQMDAGPPKMRRRSTAAIRQFSQTLTLTNTQRQTLDTFYITTLSEGVDAFDWTDPVDDTTQEFRFVSPPRYRPTGGANSEWQVQLELEILP